MESTKKAEFGAPSLSNGHAHWSEPYDSEIENKKKKKGSGLCCRKFLRQNLLLILLLIGLGTGIGLGVGLKAQGTEMTKRDLMYFRFPGDLLMRMLKCLIIPLIVSSLISGLAGLDTTASGKVGLLGLLYYISTTFSAVLLGILLVSTIKPGNKSSVTNTGTADAGNIADSFLDLIRNCFPDNIIEACYRQTKTYQVPVMGFVNEIQEQNVTNITQCNNNSSADYVISDHNYTFCNVTKNVSTVVSYDFSIRKEDGMNVLGLVVFSVALGIVIGRMGEVGRPLYLVCQALADATMKLVVIVIWYSPIGIMFLIASEIIGMKDPVKEVQAVGLYMATVLTGLAIHGLLILPALYFVFVRKNPYTYLYGMLHALLTAFGTASSSATLPITYRCLEVNNKIDPRVTRFLLPVGATINMDGTALYEAVAAIFIAQSNGLTLNAAQIVATSITATLASIGVASVPQAGLVTMVIVLSALGLPAEEVTKIIAIDWLLDRFRTAVNVEGDAIGSGIIAHVCREQLQASPLPLEGQKVTNNSLLDGQVPRKSLLDGQVPHKSLIHVMPYEIQPQETKNHPINDNGFWGSNTSDKGGLKMGVDNHAYEKTDKNILISTF